MLLKSPSQPFLNAYGLLDDLWQRCPNQRSYIHGQHHWQCVAAAGLQLSREAPGCDANLVLLFALFHDSQRRTDDHDPEHGARAAQLVDECHGLFFRLNDTDRSLLRQACRYHADGTITDHPTLSVCWDADRLNLWRGGIEPDPKLLSTPYARRVEVIEAARNIWRRPLRWQSIFRAYSRWSRHK